MHDSQKIDSLVARLAATNGLIEDIVRATGRTMSKEDDVFLVHIGTAPFESAKVSTFNEKIDLEFTLSAGSWRLRDITDDPQAWKETVPMPDTGRIQVYRDWNSSNMVIACTAIVEGDGPLQDYVIQGLHCRITRR